MADDYYPTLTHDQAKARAHAEPGLTVIYRTPDGEGHSYLVPKDGSKPLYARLTVLDDKQGRY